MNKRVSILIRILCASVTLVAGMEDMAISQSYYQSSLRETEYCVSAVLPQQLVEFCHRIESTQSSWRFEKLFSRVMFNSLLFKDIHASLLPELFTTYTIQRLAQEANGRSGEYPLFPRTYLDKQLRPCKRIQAGCFKLADTLMSLIKSGRDTAMRLSCESLVKRFEGVPLADPFPSIEDMPEWKACTSWADKFILAHLLYKVFHERIVYEITQDRIDITIFDHDPYYLLWFALEQYGKQPFHLKNCPSLTDFLTELRDTYIMPLYGRALPVRERKRDESDTNSVGTRCDLAEPFLEYDRDDEFSVVSDYEEHRVRRRCRCVML